MLKSEEEYVKDMEQCAADARENFDLLKNVHNTHDHIKGLNDIIEIDSDYDSDYYDDDYITRMVNRKDSYIRDNRYAVDPDKNQDDVLVEELNEGDEEKHTILGRGHRVKTQTATDYVLSQS